MDGRWLDYSKSVGWLVCLLIGRLRSDGWSVASRLVCYLICRSVEPYGRLAIQPPNDWPSKHSSDRWPTNQIQFFYKRAMLEFLVSVVRHIPVFVPLVGCGGDAWPMPARHWSILGSVLASLCGGYAPPRFDEQSLDRYGNTLEVCDLLWHDLWIIGLPTCNGLRSIFDDTPWDQPTPLDLNLDEQIVTASSLEKFKSSLDGVNLNQYCLSSKG